MTVEANTTPQAVAATASPAGHRRIGLRALAGTFGTCVIIEGFTVLQGIIIARLLGPTGRGEYATVILWPNVFAAIGIFGTNIALARAAAKTDRYDAVIRTALFLAVITGAISSAACYFLLPYLLPDAESHLLGLSKVFVTCIMLNHLALNLKAVDQGAANFKRYNFTRALLYPVYVLFLIAMWVTGTREVKWAAIGLLTANVVVVLVRLLLALKDVNLWGHLYSPVTAIRESVRFGLVGAATPLYLQADKAILLWLLGSANLGLYTVALSASAAIGSITSSTGIISFTVAAQAQLGEGFDRIAKAFRASALLWLVFGGILAFAMPILLPLVYGGEFAPAVNPARLLIVGSAFAGLANLLDQAMRGQGRALVGLEARIGGLMVMGGLGIVLSGKWGLMGMCLAYLAGQTVYLTLMALRSRSHYGPLAGYYDFLPGKADCIYVYRTVAHTCTKALSLS